MSVSAAEQFQAKAFFWKCLRNYHVYLGFIFLSVLVAVIWSAVATPQYQATAVVGERDSRSLNVNVGGLSVAGGLASQWTNGNDPSDLFAQFAQLLVSNKLAQDMANKYHFLPVIFSSRWDAETGKWREQSLFIVSLKQVSSIFTHRPLRNQPDADDLSDYLSSKIQITKIAPLTSSALFRSPTLLSVTFRFRDPVLAQQVLTAVLNDVDATIRANRIQNTSARISYLEEVLPHVTQEDQRAGLVAALTQQYGEMASLRADERYASTLIDAPHASITPVSPNIVELLLMAVIAAFVPATLMVYLLTQMPSGVRETKFSTLSRRWLGMAPSGALND